MTYCYWVYLLQCADQSYYVGLTNDYERRLWEHQSGINRQCYTYKRRPVQLVYLIDFGDVYQAIAWEKQIKRWSRKKKEALIRGDFDTLPELSLSAYGKRVRDKIVMVRRAHHDNLNYPCHSELIECHSEPITCHPELVEG